MTTFIEAKKIRFEQKEQAQANATATARTEQRSHSESVTSSPETGILPFQKNTFQRILQNPSSGADVKTLQKFLTEQGFDARYQGKFDGDFGRGTESALKAYQKANGLNETGILSAGPGNTSSRTLNHMLTASGATNANSSNDTVIGSQSNDELSATDKEVIANNA
jgi:peptidoglycan hydrolase-like protein with peptidoglycan-binding domain